MIWTFDYFQRIEKIYFINFLHGHLYHVVLDVFVYKVKKYTLVFSEKHDWIFSLSYSQIVFFAQYRLMRLYITHKLSSFSRTEVLRFTPCVPFDLRRVAISLVDRTQLTLDAFKQDEYSNFYIWVVIIKSWLQAVIHILM